MSTETQQAHELDAHGLRHDEHSDYTHPANAAHRFCRQCGRELVHRLVALPDRCGECGRVRVVRIATCPRLDLPRAFRSDFHDRLYLREITHTRAGARFRLCQG